MVLTSEGVVGHAEEGEAVGGGAEDVEDVAVLREAEARLGLGGELLEDAAGDGAGVARDGGELGQHDRAPRHERVHDRHPPPRSRGAGVGIEIGTGVWKRRRPELI